MKVRATKTGFYEALRSVGDVFHVPDDLQASWFIAVEDDQPNPPEKKGKKKPDDEQPPA